VEVELAVNTVVLVPVAIVVGVILLAILLFKAMWRVAEPNEALIISGLREKGIAKDSSGDEMGFRIVTGKGTLVVPGVQAVRLEYYELFSRVYAGEGESFSPWSIPVTDSRQT